jgi:hypothetical protein
MMKWVVTPLALVMIGTGVVLFPMPVPFGLALIISGMALLQWSNARLSRKLVRRLKRIYASRSSPADSVDRDRSAFEVECDKVA